MNLVPMTRFEWERVILQVQMPPTTKLVALALATFANRHGENAHPGNRRLALALGISERTVERQLFWLRECGLLMQTFHGSSGGRRRLASVYRLAIAEDLPNYVEFIRSPDTDVGCSDADHPTPATGDDSEHPTTVTRSPDTNDRSPDTRDVDHPTPVSPQQAIQQAELQQGNPSSGSAQAGALRRAIAELADSPSTTDQRVARGLRTQLRYLEAGE
jgi:biotin operon repressor